METNIEDIVLESLSVTTLTFKHEVGHKLHLNGNRTFAFTFFTTSAFSIEREIAGGEAHLLREWLLGEETAYLVICFYIDNRIRTRTLADGILIYKLYSFDRVDVTF